MDLRKRRSQEKLQVALAQHLQNQTIDEITIGELTKTAGVSRQTFYSNFESKQSILLNRIETLFDKTRIYFEANATRDDVGREGLIEQSLKHFLTECDRDRAMMLAAFTGQAGIQCLSRLKVLMNSFISDRVKFLFNFQFDDKHLDIITDFYAGAFIGTIQGWLMNEDPDRDLDFVAKQVSLLMPHGLDTYLSNSK